MAADQSSNPAADATTAFEHALREVILSAYSAGATVETTLEIDAPVSDAPNWRVTIEKEPPAERSYDPALLEE